MTLSIIFQISSSFPLPFFLSIQEVDVLRWENKSKWSCNCKQFTDCNQCKCSQNFRAGHAFPLRKRARRGAGITSVMSGEAHWTRRLRILIGISGWIFQKVSVIIQKSHPFWRGSMRPYHGISAGCSRDLNSSDVSWWTPTSWSLRWIIPNMNVGEAEMNLRRWADLGGWAT